MYNVSSAGHNTRNINYLFSEVKLKLVKYGYLRSEAITDEV